jgi:hypothetical protein
MTLSRSGRGVSWRQLVDINIPQGRTPLEPPRTSARPPLPRPSPNAPGTQRLRPAWDADLAEVWERPGGRRRFSALGGRRAGRLVGRTPLEPLPTSGKARLLGPAGCRPLNGCLRPLLPDCEWRLFRAPARRGLALPPDNPRSSSARSMCPRESPSLKAPRAQFSTTVTSSGAWSLAAAALKVNLVSISVPATYTLPYLAPDSTTVPREPRSSA